MKPEGSWGGTGVFSAGGVGGAGDSGGHLTAERCPCGGTNLQHYQGCLIALGKQAADRMHLELEGWAREMIRALIKEATDPLVARIAELEARTRLAAPLRYIVNTAMIEQGYGPIGPGAVTLCEVLQRILFEQRDTIPASPVGDSHSGAVVVPRGSSNPPPMVTDLSQVCPRCDMFACVCAIGNVGKL